ncbi:MAG: GntR family transcriptional regulator [Clostridiales bacterium]|nr:GntR family transcriptional regulator [Clostridiales bacterium]
MPWYFENDRSIYIQLVEQIQNRIATGVYPPGSRLASVRELAQEAEVNPNTMQRALAELERMGLVHSQRTSGRFVTEDEGKIQNMKKEAAKKTIHTFLEQMAHLGFEKDEILDLIREEQGVTEDEQ